MLMSLKIVAEAHELQTGIDRLRPDNLMTMRAFFAQKLQTAAPRGTARNTPLTAARPPRPPCPHLSNPPTPRLSKTLLPTESCGPPSDNILSDDRANPHERPRAPPKKQLV